MTKKIMSNSNISSSAITLYIFLLDEFTEKGNPFQLSDRKLAKQLKLSRRTIKTSREKLKEQRFIEFNTMKGVPIEYVMNIE